MTKKIFIIGVGLVVSFTGCLGWRQFSDGLQGYQGQNVESMVTRFGAPNRSVEIPGTSPRVVYTWQIRNKGGEHVCDVTAFADKESGIISKVSDSCRNVG